MDSTFILGQNSTAVPIRSGIGASASAASAASILSGQLSTAATSKDNPASLRKELENTRRKLYKLACCNALQNT